MCTVYLKFSVSVEMKSVTVSCAIKLDSCQHRVRGPAHELSYSVKGRKNLAYGGFGMAVEDAEASDSTEESPESCDSTEETLESCDCSRLLCTESVELEELLCLLRDVRTTLLS